jgi:uncharacterized protein
VGRIWRSWVLLVLLVGPVLAYIGFGTLWLYQRGWLLAAGSAWFASGLVFAWLAARWTKSRKELLPPIDWNAPRTFAQIDRDAWRLVEAESEHGDTISLQALTEFDVYIDTGRRLARTLADHYHPLSADPIDNVPVVDLLTALELASEDLSALCRQVPGGDMLTPSHWKKAVQVAGYFQRANDIYSYLLPIFSPISGLVRLGTQQLMVKPAWKDMQQNLLRWFFRAYVNRLGVHLIELYSGRLAIGAEQYRRLTRHGKQSLKIPEGEAPTVRIAVAGARGAGKSRLIALVKEARTGDTRLLKAHLSGLGLDETSLERLGAAEWFEVPGYTTDPGPESARDRSTRREAVEEAVEADLLILLCDARRESTFKDAAFARAWDDWFVQHPTLDLPPALAVVSAIDAPHLGGEWRPPYDWEKGQGPREIAARARLDALRVALPPSFASVVPAGLAELLPFGVAETLLPALLTQFHRAERSALIRHLRRVSTRSKAGRLVAQVGEHGRWLWSNLRTRRKSTAGS